MRAITELEKRQEESKRHMGLVQYDVLGAFYHGKTVAFAEALQILKGAE